MSVHEGPNKENSPNGGMNFKKLRKEISKKIEVTIDERAKEGKSKLSQNRKQSSSSKGLKGKVRDESL
jgi:predicted FMN-binding regulatory protein PaiB